MSTETLPQVMQYGTAADRAAYTPVMPTIGAVDIPLLFVWMDTDNLPTSAVLWAWDQDAMDWVKLASGGITKYSEQGPPSTSDTWVVTHNLGTEDVHVQVRELATGEITGQTIAITDANTVTITSVPDMAEDDFQVVILG